MRGAVAKERELRNDGFTVVRAIIEPEDFPRWCQAHKLEPNWRARREFAKEVAMIAREVDP
jgi:hypothetical protein